MPSARELKMRQMLEQKKQALRAKQHKQQAEIAQKASFAPFGEKFSPESSSPLPSLSANLPKVAKKNKAVKVQKFLQERENAIESQTVIESKAVAQSAEDSIQNNFRFQAIGTVFGQVRQNAEEEFWVDLNDGRTIRLWVRKSQQDQLLKISQEEKSLYLNVYPKAWLIPGSVPQLYLYVLRWFTPTDWQQKSWNEKVGVFVLRGVWQFHPQSKCNVMTIYRNANAFAPSGRYKASHLPIAMERDDIRAFCYQRKQNKEEGFTRWFVQGRFWLNQDLTKLQWFEDIAPPTTNLPRYKKTKKKFTQNTKRQKAHQKEKPGEILLEGKESLSERE